MRTYKEHILDILFSATQPLTVAQIIALLPSDRITGEKRYISATISGVLRKLVQKGRVQYANRELLGPRGGNTYKIKR